MTGQRASTGGASAAGEIEALAVYGSLAPGESNHWVVNRIRGDWITGTVRGHCFEITWGPAEGYQGFIPDPDGSAVSVSVLLSAELGTKWREIDEFEGEGYERSLIEVVLDDGTHRQAHIYVALTEV